MCHHFGASSIDFVNTQLGVPTGFVKKILQFQDESARTSCMAFKSDFNWPGYEVDILHEYQRAKIAWSYHITTLLLVVRMTQSNMTSIC